MHSWYMSDGVFNGYFICNCVSYFVISDACVRFEFLYSDFVLGQCDEVYYEGYEKYVWVIVLGGWSSDIVIYEGERNKR